MNNKYIFDNATLLCEAAADHIVELSKKAIAEKGRFTIALSGGNTPRKLYQLLATERYSSTLDWNNIFIFWGDERCVPANDENNNSHMAFTSLLNHVTIPKENVFPIPVDIGPAQSAITYEQTLQQFFKESLPAFDLILLGLGDNGHTASLFPFTDILKETAHTVKEVFIKELNAYRISFTVPLINNAHHILYLVTGEGKASIIKTIFSGIDEPEKYPVQLIKETNGSWYLDQPAAAQLKK